MADVGTSGEFADTWAILNLVKRAGPDALVADGLEASDLAMLGWSGDRVHIDAVKRELARTETGAADYIALRSPSGTPIAKAAIDYEVVPGSGTIWQVGVRPDLRGCGLGGKVVSAAERQVLARGLFRARLSVEPDNAVALGLYTKLGYVAIGERETGWDEMAPDGSIVFYETKVVDMLKVLS